MILETVNDGLKIYWKEDSVGKMMYTLMVVFQ